jgi:hypothetical protein
MKKKVIGLLYDCIGMLCFREKKNRNKIYFKWLGDDKIMKKKMFSSLMKMGRMLGHGPMGLFNSLYFKFLTQYNQVNLGHIFDIFLVQI